MPGRKESATERCIMKMGCLVISPWNMLAGLLQAEGACVPPNLEN